MSETNDSESLQRQKVEVEIRKLEAEVHKLELEAKAARDAQVRNWIVSMSVIVAIGTSGFGAYQSLRDIGLKNRHQALEAQVRSHEIFLNQVLDRASAFKVRRQQFVGGQWVDWNRELFGDVTQGGAYGAIVSLACAFENLRLPAEAALGMQVALQPDDAAAKDMLSRIRSGCPAGWDALTEGELLNWARAYSAPASAVPATK